MGSIYFYVLFSCFVVICAGYKAEKQQCNAPNEVLSCEQKCPQERTCRNRGIQFSCLLEDKRCKHKCICKEGYYRNSIGQCITGEECDQCKEDYEFYSCGQECDNVCGITTQNRTNCPLINIQCVKKCYCDDGYARDPNGKCVPLDKCPVSENKCTDPNEDFVDCKQTCPPDTCRSLVARYDCSQEPPCKPGCACKSGFLKNDTGLPCIPICECPEMRYSPDCAKK